MPSAEFDELLAVFRASQQAGERSVEDARAGWEALAARFAPAEDLKYTRDMADGVPVEWVEAPGADPSRVVLYLHGGGYVLGSVPSYRAFAGRLSRAAGARVLLVDYRLAPEHPFPAAVNDVVLAGQWLARQVGGLSRVVVAGDSAGGGLALSLMLSLRDAGHALPAMAVCISPSTDLAKTGESIRTRAHLDPLVSVSGTHVLARRYLGENGDPTHPLASPLYGELKGLPPLLVMVGTHEILHDDSTRLADKARAAGVDVTLEVWQDMVHIWPFFAAILPEGQEAVERIGTYIKAGLPQPS
jgi:acetyl esterase/lipase